MQVEWGLGRTLGNKLTNSKRGQKKGLSKIPCDHWIWYNGTNVCVDAEGRIQSGPSHLRGKKLPGKPPKGVDKIGEDRSVGKGGVASEPPGPKTSYKDQKRDDKGHFKKPKPDEKKLQADLDRLKREVAADVARKAAGLTKKDAATAGKERKELKRGQAVRQAQADAPKLKRDIERKVARAIQGSKELQIRRTAKKKGEDPNKALQKVKDQATDQALDALKKKMSWRDRRQMKKAQKTKDKQVDRALDQLKKKVATDVKAKTGPPPIPADAPRRDGQKRGIGSRIAGFFRRKK